MGGAGRLRSGRSTAKGRLVGGKGERLNPASPQSCTRLNLIETHNTTRRTYTVWSICHFFMSRRVE